MSIAIAVVVFPTPEGPIRAPDLWDGGYGAGGCGQSNFTSLGLLRAVVILILSSFHKEAFFREFEHLGEETYGVCQSTEAKERL